MYFKCLMILMVFSTSVANAFWSSEVDQEVLSKLQVSCGGNSVLDLTTGAYASVYNGASDVDITSLVITAFVFEYTGGHTAYIRDCPPYAESESYSCKKAIGEKLHEVSYQIELNDLDIEPRTTKSRILFSLPNDFVTGSIECRLESAMGK